MVLHNRGNEGQLQCAFKISHNYFAPYTCLNYFQLNLYKTLFNVSNTYSLLAFLDTMLTCYCYYSHQEKQQFDCQSIKVQTLHVQHMQPSATAAGVHPPAKVCVAARGLRVQQEGST